MSEVGTIVEGRVMGIQKYGAFLKFPNGKEGLIHISEIANEFVTDVTKYIQQGQLVKVKILNENKDGKYDLSLKQVDPNAQVATVSPDAGASAGATAYTPAPRSRKPFVRHQAHSFEEKMSLFLRKSDEKQTDLRRSIKIKQGMLKKKKKKL